MISDIEIDDRVVSGNRVKLVVSVVEDPRIFVMDLLVVVSGLSGSESRTVGGPELNDKSRSVLVWRLPPEDEREAVKDDLLSVLAPDILRLDEGAVRIRVLDVPCVDSDAKAVSTSLDSVNSNEDPVLVDIEEACSEAPDPWIFDDRVVGNMERESCDAKLWVSLGNTITLDDV